MGEQDAGIDRASGGAVAVRRGSLAFQPGGSPSRHISSEGVVQLRRRWVLTAAACVVVAGLLAIPAVHLPFLRAMGWMLVANDPLAPADIIVVTADSDGAGVLEAADLVREGVAPAVAFFQDPPDTVDREFLRRGIPYYDAGARSVQQLKALGVQAIEQIPRTVTGTNDEGEVLPEWLAHKKYRAVVVVCLSDHSRRIRRVIHRSMKDDPGRVVVRYSRYSRFDPDRWWQSRDNVRTAIVELQKLLLDVVVHPVS